MIVNKFSLLACGLSLAVLSGCNAANTDTNTGQETASNPEPQPKEKSLTIAVIPKGTTHSYWKSVEKGARKAAGELGTTIIYKGPLKENDRADQIKIVQQFSAEGVDAMVLSPLDNAALVAPVKAVHAKKIPIVIIDSALNGTPGLDFNSYVATNNGKGGELAAQRLIKLLGGKGKVVMMRYLEGSASTAEREAGFLKVIQRVPGIQVLVENRYAGATVDEAKTTALNMVDQLKAADGIFTPNEPSTFGMTLALRQARLAGKKKFVGFDASPSLLDALDKGDINTLVVQNPEKMGYEGVKAAVAAVKGEKVSAVIDTGVAVVDKANVKSAPIQQLLGSNS